MSSSIRGPQRRPDAPYVLHLEKVCQLIDRGQAVTVEFHPNADFLGPGDPGTARAMLEIHEGGDVSLSPPGHSGNRMFLGLTLANYGRLWCCWAGAPGEAQRRATKWKG